MIQPNQTYVLDRGYMEYQLVQDVDDGAAWVVVRAYNNIEVETIEELPVIRSTKRPRICTHPFSPG